MISVTKLLTSDSPFTTGMNAQEPAAPGSAGRTGPVVVWNATRDCNLECMHCVADSAVPVFSRELTTAEARVMIDDLARLRVRELVITGGEPLLRSDIPDLARYATTLGIPVTLMTNGLLIGDETARILAESGVGQVVIGLYGDETTNDRLRRMDKAYTDALRAIRSCHHAGIVVVVSFTVTRENVSALDSVFRMVEREGVRRLRITHLVYGGEAAYLAGIDLLPSQQRTLMSDVLEQVERWKSEGRDIEVMTSGNEADAPYVYYWLVDRDPQRASTALGRMDARCGNRAGIDLAGIDSDGLVHPDALIRTHTVGSIRERPFSAIWSDSRIQLLEALRDRPLWLEGRCATCQWLCVCNGNSRARAESATGDFWQDDPACYLLDAEVVPGVAD